MTARPYRVRTVTDWVGAHGLGTVYEVYEVSSERVVYRSYNLRDARIEAAHSNKFGGKS